MVGAGHGIQVVLVYVSLWANRLVRLGRQRDIDWVVGPYETAALVHNISSVIPSSYSVVLAAHPYYSFSYDFQPKPSRAHAVAKFRAAFYGPMMLGRLACRAKGFIYVSGVGFLTAERDQRTWEFRFLKRRGLRLVCYFTGNDIRSPKLMRELEVATGRPNLGTYLAEVHPAFRLASYDDAKRRVAAVADRYADVVFNAAVDQRSYLTTPTHPFMYFHPDDDVTKAFGKYAHIECPVIVHAPSTPILKGTQLVRAAIAQLREEGYRFEYVELIDVPHEVITGALSRAHIALNEFYAVLPGVFGVEAMAAGCALLTSADETIETQLPQGSNQAWVVTAHHQVVTNLRALLDQPERMEVVARAGVRWVRDHATRGRSGIELLRILSEAA